MLRLKDQAALFAITKKRPMETTIDLQILAAGLPKPEAELQFAKSIGRNWRADLAWPEYKILFEQEGNAFGNVVQCAPGSFTNVRAKGGGMMRKVFSEWTTIRLGGRHNTGAGMQADCEKYSWAAILGWTVVRATTTMIRDGAAITLLESAFRAKGFESNVGKTK
jgi:hypothetical protein